MHIIENPSRSSHDAIEIEERIKNSQSKVLSEWEKDEDGNWKAIVDIGIATSSKLGALAAMDICSSQYARALSVVKYILTIR